MAYIKNYTKNIPNEYYYSFTRASVVPYFVVDGERRFLFGVSSDSDLLCDLGGGVDENEDFIDAAIRELYEESMGLISIDYDSILENSIAMYNEFNVVLFILVEIEDADELCNQFHETYIEGIQDNLDSVYLETSYMLWISESDLRLLCKGEEVYIPESIEEAYGSIYPNINEDLKIAIFNGMSGHASLVHVNH